MPATESVEPWPPDISATRQDSNCSPKQYTMTEWSAKKHLIEKLYINEGKTLKETMTIMSQEHNFHATCQMYKKKFSKWGFTKNYTEDRVNNLLHRTTEKNSVGKASKFGINGKKVDLQRVKTYFKRKNVEMPTLSVLELQLDRDVTPTLARSLPRPSYNYEQNCPYQPWPLKFRLTEEFSSGSLYTGDSFGNHSYISVDKERPCTENCQCRQLSIRDDFTFVVYKTSTAMEVTICSDTLYSELLDILGWAALLENFNQQKTVDGLFLLSHYRSLKTHLKVLPESSYQTSSLVSEVTLLVDGLLADGEVFKSFGYEDLYKRSFLDYELWKQFQINKLERDISDVVEGFYAVDDLEREDLPVPPINQDPIPLLTKSPDSLPDAKQTISTAVDELSFIFSFGHRNLDKPIFSQQQRWDTNQ
ncbi:MAG: hypothetical protein MMC33_004038 [Icmadophila ericetorum]|nr:hypothetical protein [Icmadophila ericetorum]